MQVDLETERLWHSIMYGEVYLNEYRNPAEVRQQVGEYVKFYNEQRPHQALGYRTHASVYWQPDNPSLNNQQVERSSYHLLGR